MKIVVRALLAACSLVVLTPSTAPAATLPDGVQKITVTASSYSTSYAHLSAWQTSGGSWVRVLGPWTARVGYNGTARPGQERENSGKTPSGTYSLGFMFGAKTRPAGVSWPVWRPRPYGRTRWSAVSSISRGKLRISCDFSSTSIRSTETETVWPPSA